MAAHDRPARRSFPTPRDLPGHLAEVTRDMYASRDLEEHRAAVRLLQRAQQRRLGPVAQQGRPSVTVSRNPALPSLAWCCTVRDLEHEFVVGPGVEARDDFLFEGIWDGDFGGGAIDATEFAFGSGARWGEEVVFVPPKHAWEFLFVLRDHIDGVTVVSNSLNLALVMQGTKLTGSFFPRVARDLRSSTDAATAAGVDLYDPFVARGKRYELLRMIFTNFSIVRGVPQLRPSEPRRHFDDFSSYRSFLLDTLARLGENGRAPQRTRQLHPLTSISNGYDSTAVGALAAELAWRDAITIDVRVKGHDDSGEAVARALGLDVTRVPHVLGSVVPQLAHSFGDPMRHEIAEFVATAGLGDDVMLRPFEPHLQGRILLSGAMGDSAWRRPSRFGSGLPVSVPYGKSFSEFRLRVGYAYLPVPALGARFAWPLRELTAAKEMEPYTLFQPYDRPIARRLAEEAGVQRGTFATKKAATNPTVQDYDDLFTPSVRQVMCRYADALEVPPPPGVEVAHTPRT